MVHTHVRGELGLQLPYMWLSPGSSPRAWGTLPHGVHQVVSERFIPRCVGNSVNRTHRLRVSVVHPHVRGELDFPKVANIQPFGSSPRAWGTHQRYAHRRCCDRFIPTCVGNSLHSRTSVWVMLVHPHMGGELGDRSSHTSAPVGSSPGTWGTPGNDYCHEGCERFIPRCVGNSSIWGIQRLSLVVHPQVRGELRADERAPYCRNGSSPRAWGTPFI